MIIKGCSVLSMRHLLAAAALLAVCGSALAQVSIGGEPRALALRSLAPPPVHALGFIDLAAYEAEDNQAGKDEAFRFGAPVPVDLGLNNAGEWTELEDGRLWRLALSSEGAYSLNCRFDEFELPPGGEFFVYSADGSMSIGAFTLANNKADGRFAIQPVAGETIVLEYFEPAKVAGQGRIHIETVVHDYRGFFDIVSRGFGDSGSCNNDVACPVSAGWENEIRSVGMLLEGGFRYCSGAMINNTADDGRQLFLSANHCSPGSNDIVMFNYQSPSCNGPNGPTTMSAQGLTARASGSTSDFYLVEIQEAIPAAWNVYLAGFDASGATPSSTVGIHHPSGDVKKISFDNDAPGISGYGGGGGTSHWHIYGWEDGTTEGGSSGSPLFSQTGRIIGQLHGGQASCSYNYNDYYGRLSVSWSAGASGVLDPLGTGQTSIGGRELAGGGGGGPVNDACGNALPIGDGVTAYSTVDATQTATMPCAAGGGPDLWYRYTSLCGADVTVSTCNDADYDTAIAVWDGCGGSAVACNDDFSGCGLTSQVSFTAAAGVNYYIQVAGYGGASGSGNLTVSSTGLANDTCAGALAIGTGGTEFNTECATQTVTMPCAGGGGPDLWYSYTAPSAGELTVETCGAATYDTALAIYESCGGTLIQCNDDACSLQSRVTGTLGAGQTVVIQVAGYSGAVGSGTLQLAFVPAGEDNDDCAGATLVGEGSHPFSNVGATTDGPDEPGACLAFNYSQVGSDIWYEYIPAQGGTATVSLCGSGYDTKLAVYEGTCPAGPSAIACNDDFCGLQSQVEFGVSGGVSYFIRIGGYNGAQGSGTMTISLEGAGCPDETARAPENLTIAVDGSDVLLSWDAVTESVADCPLSGVSYTIYVADLDGNITTYGTASTGATLVGLIGGSDLRTIRVTADGTVALRSGAAVNTVESGEETGGKPEPVMPEKAAR
jgi:hypothetical protein